MGQSWGIIYNGLDQQVLYCLHSLPFSPFDQAIQKQKRQIKKLQFINNAYRQGKGLGQANNYQINLEQKKTKGLDRVLGNSSIGSMIKKELQKNNNLSAEDAANKLRELTRPKTSKERRQEYLKIENVYTVLPNFYSKSGLNKIDFEKYRYISIITFSGRKVMTGKSIKQHCDVRIKLGNFVSETGEQLLYQHFTKQKSNKIKDKVMSQCLRNITCQKCNKKLHYTQTEEQHICQACSCRTNQFWACINNEEYKSIQDQSKKQSIKKGQFVPITRQVKWHEFCTTCYQVQQLMNAYMSIQKDMHRDVLNSRLKMQAKTKRYTQQGRLQDIPLLLVAYNEDIQSLTSKGYDEFWDIPVTRQDREDVNHQYF